MSLNLTTERLPGSKLEIRVEADAAEIEKAYDRVFSLLAEQAQVPGFRPGRAPRAILERRFPAEDLRRMAWREFLENSFAPALEELKIRPLGEPELPDLEDVEAFQRGQEFELVTTVAVHPEPSLPDYHALKLVAPSAEVTSEDVDEQLERLRLAHARREVADRDEVAEGDSVSVCVHVTDAQTGEELDHSDSEVTAGAEGDSELARRLVGAKKGEELEFEMTLSEPQPDPELVGKQARLKAQVEQIHEVILHDLNEEFAKSVDETLETVEDLREYVKGRLQEQFDRQRQRALRDLAIALVDAGTRMELPESLVQSMTHAETRKLHEHLVGEGLSQEAALEMLQDRETGLLEQAAMDAMQNLRLHYIFQALAEAEGLEPGEEDVDRALVDYAREYGLEAGHLRQMVDMQPESEHQFHDQALRRLVVDRLLESAEVQEVARDAYPLMARRLLEEAHEQAQKGAVPVAPETPDLPESSDQEKREPEAPVEEAPEPEQTEES